MSNEKIGQSIRTYIAPTVQKPDPSPFPYNCYNGTSKCCDEK